MHPNENPADEKARQSVELLPPVQPPEARFLMQLFVTPLLIVAVIVGVFFLVTWLARPNQNPAVLVDRIERLDHRSWQQALALANQLRNSDSNELRLDQSLARRLSSLLTAQLQLKSPSEERVRLQIYLCRALGEFDVDTGLATLVKAASPEPSWRNPLVRRAAIQSIGMLFERLGNPSGAQFDEARDVLFAALKPSGTTDTAEEKIEALRLRSTATYVLGLSASPEAQQKLETLLDDPEPDIRFNAATGLARQGNGRAALVLKQMLAWDPAGQPGSSEPVSLVEARQKRELVVSAALRGILVLQKRQPTFDIEVFRVPVEAISRDTTIAQSVQKEARDVLHLINAAKTKSSQVGKVSQL